MTVHVTFSPEIEAKLVKRARESGKEVEALVREVVEERLAETAVATRPLSAERRLQLLREWAQSHPARPGVNLDDSRESIYAGRGE